MTARQSFNQWAQTTKSLILSTSDCRGNGKGLSFKVSKSLNSLWPTKICMYSFVRCFSANQCCCIQLKTSLLYKNDRSLRTSTLLPRLQQTLIADRYDQNTMITSADQVKLLHLSCAILNASFAAPSSNYTSAPMHALLTQHLDNHTHANWTTLTLCNVHIKLSIFNARCRRGLYYKTKLALVDGYQVSVWRGTGDVKELSSRVLILYQV